jgi:hypothetical protein
MVNLATTWSPLGQQLLGDELEVREPAQQHADALLHPARAFGLHEDDRVVVDHVRGDNLGQLLCRHPGQRQAG